MSKSLKKVLCIRLSAIGDVVVCTPVFRALAMQLGAEVHVLTKPVPGIMLEGNPHVHKVIHWQEKGLVEQLKKERYDVVVDLHCNLRSHRLRLTLGVPALGYRKRNLAKRLLGHGIDWLGDEHILDRYFKALEPLGISYDLGGLDYFAEEEMEWSTAVAARLEVPRKEGFIALVLGATHATKRMPATLLADICKQSDRQLILLGGNDVKALAAETLGFLDDNDKSKVTNLCGELSLRQSAKLIEQAKGVITPDTGLMHVAAALHRPMVVVWGNTVPAYGMYPLLPAGREQLAQYAQVEGLSCRPCGRIGFEVCPKGHFKCMNDQSATSILKLLDKSQSENTRRLLA
ncbi:MAG: glycosyltransferase family 9 protein [Saprospiraceae bacterium]